jgi:hypothetical protein
VDEYLYVTNGIYDPTSDETTWDSPYLASLKVGNLSAISANLGSVTSGDITLVNNGFVRGGMTQYMDLTNQGFWMGENGGNYVFSMGDPGNPTGNYISFNGSVVMIKGTLTADAINAVGTINLAGDAVTVGSVVFGSGPFSLTSNILEVNNLDPGVAPTSVGSWYVIFQAEYQSSGSPQDDQTIGIRLYHYINDIQQSYNTTTYNIVRDAGSCRTGVVQTTVINAPTPGVHKFVGGAYFIKSANGSGSLRDVNMYVTGAKK